MECYSRWFDHFGKWAETIQAADFAGFSLGPLAVGDIVHQAKNTLKQHYRVQRIEYRSNQVAQVELAPVSIGSGNSNGVSSAPWIKATPEEVVRVEHSVLQSHLTQDLLSLSNTLLSGVNHSDSTNNNKAVNQANCTNLLNDSTQRLSMVTDALYNGGLTLAQDVRNFLIGDIELFDPDADHTNSSSAKSDALSTSALNTAANADIETTCNLLRRYDTFLSSVRDLYLILACLLDIATHFATLDKVTRTNAGSVSDTIQDIENETSPAKMRLNTQHEEFSVIVNAALAKILSLEAVLVGVTETHPVPYLVSVIDWAKSMCTMNTLQPAVETLQRSYLSYTTAMKRTIERPTVKPVDYENLLSTHRNSVIQAVDAHVHCAVQSLSDFYAQSSIENILRQEWSSHSKYMRDKKLTHGIVSLCATIRQTVHEYYQQQAHYVRTTVPYCAHLSAQSNTGSAFSLQMLLSVSVLVSRTYLGNHVPTEEENALNNSDTNRTTNHSITVDAGACTSLCPLLDVSRVRTAQWQKDQYYFVHMVLETVVWTLTQDALHQTNVSIERNVADSALPAAGSDALQAVSDTSIRQLLQSEHYVIHARVLSELVLVLKYLLLSLYISSGNAEEVVNTMSRIVLQFTARSGQGENVARDAPRTATGEANLINNGVQVWDGFMELLRCLSTGDNLESYVNIRTNSINNDTTSLDVISSVPIIASLESAFPLYNDMHTHTGLYSFHVNPANTEEETTLHLRELQVSNNVPSHGTAVAAAHRGVVLHRIASMNIKSTDPLLVLLTSDFDRFCALHDAIHIAAQETVREPINCVREFVQFALLRRYEMNLATYPPLTTGETESAVCIKAFLESMKIPV